MTMVLLVDEDTLQLTKNADALLSAGHQVCTAVDTREALEELEWNQPDVLVCDAGPRNVDGWSLVRHLRGDERYARLSIVLLGAADDKELRLMAFRNGVDDYLPKPFEPEELVRRLDRILRRSRIIERPFTGPPPSDVQGRLENFPLGSVLRLLALEKKTGVLLVQHSGACVRIELHGGELGRVQTLHELSNAWSNALSMALAWNSGEFWFTEQSLVDEGETRTSVAELLDGSWSRAHFRRRA